jgi:hypothetical protein
MPWQNTPDDRRRSDATYASPEYVRNRAAARRRAGGYCEQCRHRHPRLQCDHVVNAASTGKPDHSLANLQMLCVGDGSCKCHEKKTSQEGNAGRRQSHDPLPEPRTRW